WPGTTVAATNSILSIRPSSIAAIRTLRANGEAGEKESFMASFLKDGRREVSRHCERSEAIQSSASRKVDCFVACAPRNDGGAYPLEYARLERSRRDDFLALLAEPLDAEGDDVT